MMNISEQYDMWRTNPYFDKATNDELEAVFNSDDEIYDRFYRDLEFGTAGLRGVMGAGINRMNKYVVRRASTAIADMITEMSTKGQKSVIIAYDTRNNSKEYAEETAAVFAGKGIKTVIFSNPTPVPVLSYAVISRNFTVGIMITASHNPKEYNGYKVYWSDGAQISPEIAEDIQDRIDEMEDFTKLQRYDFGFFQRHGKIAYAQEKIAADYIQKVASLCVDGDVITKYSKETGIVYTPLHGAGAKWATDAFKKAGFEKVFVVKEQFEPDGNFPTVKTPNPEFKTSYALGMQLAEQKKADIIIATDPDADRMGACIRDNEGVFVTLTGNQIGALLLNYIISSKKRTNSMPEKPFAVSTIVSTDLAKAIAEDNGVDFTQVLTGFKFIGEQITNREKKGEKFIFGFEESFGSLAESYARDKDGIAAAVIFAEMALYYKNVEKKSLIEVLEDLFKKYGNYYESLYSLELKGEVGLSKTRELMEKLREIKGDIISNKVISIMDVREGTIENLEDGTVSDIDLPESDVLKYTLENGWIAVRPSGTEPKVKFYFGINEKESMEKARDVAEDIKKQVIDTAKKIILGK